MNKKCALIVLDGFGHSLKEQGNAVLLAKTPNIDRYIKQYPDTLVKTDGEFVGLTKGQMGGSEVGHLSLGVGRVVNQPLLKINKMIESGGIFKNKVLVKAFKNLKNSDKALHLIGLLSDGGIHSNINHLFAMLDMAKMFKLKNVYVHVLTDGRDTAVDSGIEFVKKLELYMKKLGVGKVATVGGRYYAMDRNKNYDRVKLAYDAMVLGVSKFVASSAKAAVTQSYLESITDEFINPTVIKKDGKPVARITSGDTILFYNFRSDRAKQLIKMLTNTHETKLVVAPLSNLNLVSLVRYDDSFKDVKVVLEHEKIKNTLGEVIAKKKLKQLRVAETTKYAHVTYFFNGEKQKVNKGEKRILVPSKDVATFDLMPEMSAKEIYEAVDLEVLSEDYGFVLINFANCDMVGHTGNLEAAIKAVETVDKYLKETVERLMGCGFEVIVTADHGNAEEMADENGKPLTTHTTNKVPLILMSSEGKKVGLKKSGKLSDVTATILDIMQIKPPKQYTGKSLIIK